METHNVYIIIVSYNGMKWLDKCLSSASACLIPINIILIDNGSTDGTQQFVASKYKDIQYIQNSENAGFGKANNIGILRAIENDADYVFLLNQDAYLEPDTISKLISFNIANPEYGVLSPKQMNGSGTALDNNFREYVLSPSNIMTNDNDTFYRVKFVMAAFWLISAACLNKAGIFDPIFSHYGEDNDYLNRVAYHGFDVGILMNSIGYHDREFRLDDDFKKNHLTYTTLLTNLLDINNSFSKSINKALVFHCQLSINCIKAFNWKIFVAAQRKFFYLMSILPHISKSRERNVKEFKMIDEMPSQIDH